MAQEEQGKEKTCTSLIIPMEEFFMSDSHKSPDSPTTIVAVLRGIKQELNNQNVAIWALIETLHKAHGLVGEHTGKPQEPQNPKNPTSA